MATKDILHEAAVSKAQSEARKNDPSYIYRPALSIDGDQWCALYGADLQNGVAGFGDSPEDAYADFDKNWYRKLPATAKVGDKPPKLECVCGRVIHGNPDFCPLCGTKNPNP